MCLKRLIKLLFGRIRWVEADYAHQRVCTVKDIRNICDINPFTTRHYLQLTERDAKHGLFSI